MQQTFPGTLITDRSHCLEAPARELYKQGPARQPASVASNHSSRVNSTQSATKPNHKTTNMKFLSLAFVLGLLALAGVSTATPLNPGNVIINGDCRVCNVRA